MTQPPKPGPPPRLLPVAFTLIALGCALGWAHWPALKIMADKWAADPQYSHGFLVPLFAVALLWVRQSLLPKAALRPSWWCIPVLLVGVGMRFPTESLNFPFELFEGLSLQITLAGLCLLLGGLPLLRYAWPAILFLVFMFPLPFRVERALALELQWLATHASTYALQTLGAPVVADGNRILLEAEPIGVEDACSGLSMLMTFVALSTAMVFLFELPWTDKLAILLSSVPIALAANVARIVVTALMMDWWDRRLAYTFFHDWAGWLMMVFALLLLVLEVWLLRRLLVVDTQSRFPPTKPLPLSLKQGLSR